ncbi:MAG: SRPBCC family protein [Polyangiaceae bacterium]
MATLHREQRLAASAERVWDGVRDIGALHTKLVPGFVLDTELDGDARIVHFANGQVLREPILSIDGARRRLAWSVESPNLTHYNAVLEVIPLGEQCKVVCRATASPTPTRLSGIPKIRSSTQSQAVQPAI